MRIEEDILGKRELPADALYGINTARALENFPLTGRTIAALPEFVPALAILKEAAALANLEIGALSAQKAEAIVEACQEIRAGRYDAHLIVDVLEGSGGTSSNMNLNEVIANLAARLAGTPAGDYSFVHPNDHVNLSQSTNDVIPTAIKLAIFRVSEGTSLALMQLAAAFSEKKREHSQTMRLGRTCLQDAVPMLFGQTFGGYQAVIERHAKHVQELRRQLLIVPLGGTAVGTGLNAGPGYKPAIFRHLSALIGHEIKPAADPFDGMQNLDACARLSAEVRNSANSLWKIANDLIVLSSGPVGAVGEVALPAIQAGSSIIPGKVNPVVPIAVCQAAFAIAGNDAAVAMACQQGLLEINCYGMLVCDRLIDSITLLERSATILRERCVRSLTVNEERCQQNLLASSGLAAALVPQFGYAKVAAIVGSAHHEHRPFLKIAIDRGLLGEKDVHSLMRRAADVSTSTAE
ncbi:aspartate ammonia-lyase [Bradyrhizobium sp. CIAT3101]|uniref:aspartate ammonia-lyase n=1 Tax=Bradyrhizobium sp. CIAT3101 TaxID=439387 RepID=UPI0024B1ECB9|nr:aspartate ammonia-lyase [Bradyrhizobium sp. CIAT3101]WFU80344.1 aspartate ammonia-lyase [Bradyrhizobium sp. CIAT3101]